jgi:hypothetical protein
VPGCKIMGGGFKKKLGRAPPGCNVVQPSEWGSPTTLEGRSIVVGGGIAVFGLGGCGLLLCGMNTQQIGESFH